MTPVRFQRRRRAGWRKPPGSVCATRPGIFGNPFTLEDARSAGYGDLSTGAVEMFQQWANGKGYKDLYQTRRAELLERLEELRGRHLGCFCPLDRPCHVDVLLVLANS